MKFENSSESLAGRCPPQLLATTSLKKATLFQVHERLSSTATPPLTAQYQTFQEAEKAALFVLQSDLR